MRSRYASLLSASEKRLRALDAALASRGETPADLWPACLRALGRVTGSLTSWAGARRMLSSDIAAIRSLEVSYFEAYHERPPAGVAAMLFAFIGELEGQRAALVEDSKPLFGRGTG